VLLIDALEHTNSALTKAEADAVERDKCALKATKRAEDWKSVAVKERSEKKAAIKSKQRKNSYLHNRIWPKRDTTSQWLLQMRQRQQRKVRLLRYFLYYCFTHINAAAGGMSRTNNDFGRSAEFLVGREKESIGKTLGTFHKLLPKLRESLMQCARENTKRMKKWYDDALERQNCHGTNT
jgi:hypothetical protein